MAERDSWATMNGATRVLDAEDSRLAIAALLAPGSSAVRARQGLRPATGNPGVVTASGTPGVNVHVAKFQAVITATRGLGEYVATLDADKTIDILTGNPAHATQVRNDLIIAKQADTYYGDGSTAFTVQRVLGVAGAGDPSLAAHPDCVLLARVRVAALTSTITSAMIDDLRPSWAAALGGLLPVKDQTERDALSPYDGFPIWRRDRKWREVHDGTAWRVQGVAHCTSTADRDTAITHPYNGQEAVTTDTGTVWVRHSSAWRAAGGVLAHGRWVADGVTAAQTWTDGAETQVQYPVARNTDTRIVVSGTNNNTFTVPAGVWHIETGARLQGGGSGLDLFIVVGGVRVSNDGGSSFLAACSAVVRTTGSTAISVLLGHSSGFGKSAATAFGDVTHLSITQLPG